MAAESTVAPIEGAATAVDVATETTAPQAPKEQKYGHWLNSLIALACWLSGLVLSAYVVHRLDLNPLTTRGVVFPAAVGALAVFVMFPIVWFVARRFAAPIVVGGFSAWLGLVMLQALNGTPWGYMGLQGDASWMVSTINRYSTNWKTVDPFDPRIPAEYPPLFHYVLGHLAAPLHMAPWQMMKYGQIVLTSLVPVLAYMLWQRLVSPGLAVVLALIPVIMFTQPLRAYEVAVLATVVPWALGAFVEQPGSRGRRLNWVVAGIIGGLYFTLYMGYLLFLAGGVLALVLWALWKSRARWRYVLRLAGISVVAFAAASWFLINFINGLIHYGGDRVNDYWVSVSLSADPYPLPFVNWTTFGVAALIGVVGLLLFWSREWWAKPLTFLVLGAFLYEAVFLLWFSLTGHTTFVHYVVRVTTSILVMAGAFTIAALAPRLFRLAKVSWPRGLSVVAAALVVGFGATYLWLSLSPKPYGFLDAHANSTAVDSKQTLKSWNLAFRAHGEPLPNGAMPKFSITAFNVQHVPVSQIQADVVSVLGKNADPMMLALDSRVFAFVKYPGYIGPGPTSANSYIQWDYRVAALRELSQSANAAAFTYNSAHTRFGPIDAFYLDETPAGYYWQKRILFAPSLFDPKEWTVFHQVAGLTNPPYVLIVRKHTSPGTP